MELIGLIVGVSIAQKISEYYEKKREKESERLMRQAPYRIVDKGDNYEIRRSSYNGFDYIAYK